MLVPSLAIGGMSPEVQGPCPSAPSAAPIDLESYHPVLDPKLGAIPMYFPTPDDEKCSLSQDENTPPWFGILSNKFNIVANGIKILRHRYNIDALVGKPDELEPRTLEALTVGLPVSAKNKLRSFLTSNLRDLFRGPQPASGQPPMPESLHAPGTNTSGGADQSSFLSTEDIARRFPKEVVMSNLRLLRADQLADLGVWALSHIPGFPKDERGWNRVRCFILNHDIYLMGVAAITVILTGSLNIHVGGSIVKFNDGKSVLGWQLAADRIRTTAPPKRTSESIKYVGEHTRGTLEAKQNFQSDFAQSVAARYETLGLLSGVINQDHKEKVWTTSGAAWTEYIYASRNPAARDAAAFSGSFAASRDEAFGAKGTNMAFNVGTGFHTRNGITGNVGTSITSERSDYSLMLAVTSERRVIYPDLADGMPQTPDFTTAYAAAYNSPQRDTKAGFVFRAGIGGGIKLLRSHIFSTANAVEKDLSDIKKYQLPEESFRHVEYALGCARLSLSLHLEDYKQLKKRFDNLRDPAIDGDPNPLRDLLPSAEEEASRIDPAYTPARCGFQMTGQ